MNESLKAFLPLKK